MSLGVLASASQTSSSLVRRVLLVVVFWSLQVVVVVGFSAAVPPPPPSNSQTRLQEKKQGSLPLELPSTFEFGSNGACLSPRLFRPDDRTDQSQIFTLRNVPGEGDCLFLAVALATLHSMGLSGRGLQYRPLAQDLRQQVVRFFSQPRGATCHISATNQPSVAALLQQAAREETNCNILEYLKALQTCGGLYGGGPELVALSNILRRPIHIYELTITATAATEEYPIQLMGTFGAGVFDDPLPATAAARAWSPWDLHILMVQASPGEQHAMALLPQPIIPQTDLSA